MEEGDLCGVGGLVRELIEGGRDVAYVGGPGGGEGGLEVGAEEVGEPWVVGVREG